MKITQNTASYLESINHRPAIINEAGRAAIRRGARLSALYGLATVSVLSVLSLSLAYLALSAQDFYEANQIAIDLVPVDVSFSTNKVVDIQPRKAVVAADRLTQVNREAVAESPNPTIAQKVCEVFTERCETALAVMQAESSGNPYALGINSDSVDVGLFQINSKAHANKDECRLDKIATVDGNIACAYRVYRDNGNSFSPWVAYKSGKYLTYVR